MTSRLWVLGPSVAPEVEALLRDVGERAVGAEVLTPEYAREVLARTKADVEPVKFERAWVELMGRAETLYLVACDVPVPEGVEVRRIERSRWTDPLTGEPLPSAPWRWLADSVVGQVVSELARLGRLHHEWPREYTDDEGIPGAIQWIVSLSGQRWACATAMKRLWADLPASLVLAAASETPGLAVSEALNAAIGASP